MALGERSVESPPDPAAVAWWLQRAVRYSMPVFFGILLLLPFLPALGGQQFDSFDVFDRLVVASLVASTAGNLIFFSILIRGNIHRVKSMLFSAVLAVFTTVLAMVLLLRPEAASQMGFHLGFAIALHVGYLLMDRAIARDGTADEALRNDFQATVRNIDAPTLIGLGGSALLAAVLMGLFHQSHVEVERFVAGATTFQVIFNWVASGLAQDPKWMGHPATARG